jgi:hypothetical protein
MPGHHSGACRQGRAKRDHHRYRGRFRYDYDVLNRLDWDSGVSSTNPTYTYDANGNRLTRAATVSGFTTQTIAYGANSNKMSTLNGTSVSYDGMGNTTSGGLGATLSYGASGRLSQVDVGTGQNDLYLLYNGLGELARARVTARDACGTTNETYREYYHFAPDGRALQLDQAVAGAGRVQADWIWIDNLPVLHFEDSYDGAGTLIGTETTYLHPDHLGTPRMGTNASATESWKFRSDGFGKATITGSHTVRLRFPGQIDLAFEGITTTTTEPMTRIRGGIWKAIRLGWMVG